jgi:hypothetical protein
MLLARRLNARGGDFLEKRGKVIQHRLDFGCRNTSGIIFQL